MEYMAQNIEINGRNIALIVNGKSKRGRVLFKHAKNLLSANDIKPSKAICLSKPHEIKQSVTQLIKSGINMIIIGGGDGTISEVVDFGAKKDIIFAILPFGTSNSFVRSMEIPLDLEEAIKVIKNGNVRKIDLGKIGNDYFANTANIGISVAVNLSVDNNSKKNFGRLAYLPMAIWNLITAKAFEVTVTTPNETKKYKCIEMLIANGQFQGGVPLALDANLSSGNLMLKIWLSNGFMDKLNLLGYWFLSIFKHNIKNRRIKQLIFNEAKIETSVSMQVDIDGEAKTETPIEVRVAKSALWIITPF